MNEPLLSIIIPAYNVEKYIEDSLFSAINQTLNDYEIVIVNDKSIDQTQKVIDKIISNFPKKKIKCIQHEENRGLSLTRKTGLENASAEYVVFLDADDMVSPNLCEECRKEIERDSYDVIFYGSLWDKGKTQKKVSNAELIKGITDTEDIKKLLIKNGAASFGEGVWRRRFLLNNADVAFTNMMYEDAASTPVLFSLLNKIGIIDETLYYYDMTRSGSITNSDVTIDKVNDYFRADSLLWERVGEDYKKECAVRIIRRAKKYYLNNCFVFDYALTHFRDILEMTNSYHELWNSEIRADERVILKQVKKLPNDIQIPKTVCVDDSHGDKEYLTSMANKAILFSPQVVYISRMNNIPKEVIDKGDALYSALKYIYDFGGIYISPKFDEDISYNRQLYEDAFFVIKDGSLSLDVFGAKPKHPLIGIVLEMIKKHVDVGNTYVVEDIISCMLTKYLHFHLSGKNEYGCYEGAAVCLVGREKDDNDVIDELHVVQNELHAVQSELDRVLGTKTYRLGKIQYDIYQKIKQCMPGNIYKIIKSKFRKNVFFQCVSIMKENQAFLEHIKSIELNSETVVFDALSGKEFLNSIFDANNKSFFYLAEQPYISQLSAQKIVRFNFELLPSMFGRAYYIDSSAHGVIPMLPQIKHKIESDYELNYVRQLLEKKYPNMKTNFSYIVVFLAESLIRKVFKILKPNSVVIWVEFVPMHRVYAKVARDMGIRVIFMEYGSLPGTIAFDRQGQMGGSRVSTESDDFMKLKVNEDEIENANKIWDYLFSTRLNRKPQKRTSNLEIVKRELDWSRPTVFFAGVNDYESGIYPYDSRAREYYSPCFSSSVEALIYVSKLAEKNGWNMLFKPHPLCFDYESQIPENVYLLKDADINEIIDMADVTITILSQVGYISCIRKKPTVMLGYTQLRGKNCTYEAFGIDSIESTIKSALNLGFTDEQRYYFAKHIAQMNKYYLFDDCKPKRVSIGKSYKELIKDGLDVIRF